ncbi:CBS domain-containing protein [Megalodesulfovibrio gigas]|uniref:Putative CBS domain pair family protein n=1 Tax=Megalodesulfovibrio gigas (strain ATCC 19364 / DSM 1382 / NCIMB 9332 / VKM B-1759) TaxID=1121448 RepID=T2GD57_MEGG1|nr:CBS domain-containing protein [Megalodesulfovibrio gigas]AGW14238.1 putative CBS domain pair family protein [Megalodesulfovibrio gigas DSM 1382 = ATCC 19364]
MLTAKDIMSKSPVTVTPSTDVATAARIMLENHFNGLPVVNNAGVLVGIVTQSDCISQQGSIKLPSYFTILDSFIPLPSMEDMEGEIAKMTAATVDGLMTKDVATVTLDTSIEEVANLMVDRRFHTLPVLDGDKLAGVIGKEDLLRVIASGGKAGGA